MSSGEAANPPADDPADHVTAASSQGSTRRGEDGPKHGGLRGRLTLIVGLLLLWVVLWGAVSPVVLFFGLLVAVGTAFMCPVPTTQLVLIRPWRLVEFAGRTAVYLIQSGATVAWQAVSYGPRTKSAVIEVPLQVETDRLVRGAVQLTGVSPGSMVLEIDRDRRVLYVHSLPVADTEEAEKRRAEIISSEAAILRAFGGSDSGSSNGKRSVADSDATGSAPGSPDGPTSAEGTDGKEDR